MDQNQEAWCGPLKLVSIRELTAEDRNALALLNRDLRCHRWGMVILTVGLTIVLPGLPVQGYSPFPEPLRPWVFLSGLFILLLMALPIGHAASHQRRMRLVSSKSRFVYQFRGTIPAQYSARWIDKKAKSAFVADGQTRQTIELLSDLDPVTKRGAILQTNGIAAEGFRLALVGYAPTDGPSRFTARLASVQLPSQQTIHLEQRHLSREEKDEIQGKIHRCFFGGLLAQLLVVAAVFVFVGFLLGGLQRSGYWSTKAGLLVSLPLSLFFLRHRYRMLRFGLALRRDHADGKAYVTRVEGAEDTVERLRHSRAVWTANGMPAPWRLLLSKARLPNSL